ncbi:unnamed protein product [Hydatigera taeniaeformis]|uniref:Secreted protein n=1 Tax=Hydatigena taeniaeformis TaxID=6205 RepID=A0A0R3WN42_HYDTA|nr:unnamed protein product [Hydatigera taeniaeformis]
MTAFRTATSTALLQLLPLPLQHSVKINAFFFFYCFFGLGARVYARWQAIVQSTVQSISTRANWSRAVADLRASRRWGVGRCERFLRESFKLTHHHTSTAAAYNALEWVTELQRLWDGVTVTLLFIHRQSIVSQPSPYQTVLL